MRSIFLSYRQRNLLLILSLSNLPEENQKVHLKDLLLQLPISSVIREEQHIHLLSIALWDQHWAMEQHVCSMQDFQAWQ